jgi:ABC-type polysaccharide/polyol phosphate transport system ATPase subunit
MALEDISFNVDRGDAMALVGRNGAGKSTMLKLISRITAPSAGEIRIHGRVASLLEVGTGTREAETIPSIFGGKRSEAGPAVPASGLCLMEL